MTVWHDRTNLYKLGFIGIVFGTLTFIVGFCAPAWVTYWKDDSPTVTQKMGLWQTCIDDLSLCTLSLSDSNPGWLKAVRALESVSVFFAVAACIVGLYCNFILKAQMSTGLFQKDVEISSMISVLFGVFGVIIFATQVRSHFHDRFSMSWGFVLVLFATFINGFSAFIMLASMWMTSLTRHFRRRRANISSLHSDESSSAIVPPYRVSVNEGNLDYGPPTYETVVDCTAHGESPPPPYEQVVKLSM